MHHDTSAEEPEPHLHWRPPNLNGSSEPCHKPHPMLPPTCPQVLLFCTMTRLLDELESYLQWRGFSFLRLDGNSGGATERGELVAKFNDPGEGPGNDTYRALISFVFAARCCVG